MVRRHSNESGSTILEKLRAEGLAEAHNKAKDQPTWGAYQPLAVDPVDDYRRLAQAVGQLGADRPERDSFLAAVGLRPNAIAPALCTALAEAIRREADFEQEELTDFPNVPRSVYARDETPAVIGLNTRNLGDVIAEKTKWIWDQRIPLGKVSFVSGDPGLGKTWLVLDIIARLTTGRGYPDGAQSFGEPCDVLFISAEDDDADTILPRLTTLKGNPRRVNSFSFLLEPRKDGAAESPLSLDRHIEQLERWLINYSSVRLIVLDPLAAFLGGKVDSHKNADVRRILTPLSKLAREYSVAIVGVNHLNKGEGSRAIYRSLGSIGFVAASRSSWIVVADPKQPKDRRLFLPVKSNLSTETPEGLAFRLRPDVGVLWEEGSVAISADEALSPPAQPRKQLGPREEAKQWLLKRLRNGAVPAKTLWGEVKAKGMCERTVKYAKEELGVESKPQGGAWYWSLAERDAATT